MAIGGGQSASRRHALTRFATSSWAVQFRHQATSLWEAERVSARHSGERFNRNCVPNWPHRSAILCILLASLAQLAAHSWLLTVVSRWEKLALSWSYSDLGLGYDVELMLAWTNATCFQKRNSRQGWKEGMCGF
jgi:hypothetical protein